MEKPTFVYVVYISSTPEKVWDALIDTKMTAQYWQNNNLSDWKPGSRWEHRTADEEQSLKLVGKVVESRRPSRLVLTWASPDDAADDGKHSRVTFDLEPVAGVVRLTVTHDRLEAGSKMLEGITLGWPKVLSSLKSLLETGRALPKLW